MHRAILAAVGFAALTPAPGGAQPATIGATFDPAVSVAFPPCAAVIDVTKPPYLAKGDGIADDTEPLRRALLDTMGQHKIVYLPNGTYRVTGPIRWANKNTKGAQAWGFNRLQGQSTAKTVIRLADATFTDAAAPTAVMWCGGFGSADWFHNYVQNLTFDTGRGNPGAIGLQFYSNNTGAVRDVAVVSGDGAGVAGLDLAGADMNGPLLVRNVAVRGFETGVRSGAVVNSQTFERVTLSGQSKVGFANRGQSVSVRGLLSENAVPAVWAESFTALLDSKLVGRGAANAHPAVKLGPAPVYVRNLATAGYAAAVGAEGKEPGHPGPVVGEYVRGTPTVPFGGPAASLGLEVKETPDVPHDDPTTWAVVDAFGADPTGNRDSAAAVQKAIDSGATTVFFPGFYHLASTVVVRGKVRRLLGTGAWLDYRGQARPDLVVAGGEAPVVVVEHFAPINGGVVIDTDRTVVFRSVESRSVVSRRRGDVFFEDVATDDVRVNPGQRVWARQLNVENEGTHLTNAGGKLWVLGYKTERGGTLLHTTAGGESEVFGNFSYTTTAGRLAPMFRTEDAAVFAFFNEVCYSGDPFRTLVREARGGEVRTVERGAGGTAPYVARPAKR